MCKSDKPFRSYSNFRKFQNGGRRPSWIFKFTNFRGNRRARSACRMVYAKFGANRTSRMQVIQALWIWILRLAAILYFQECYFWAFCLVVSVECMLGIKLCANRTNHLEVIHILLIWRWRWAASHIGFSNMWFLNSLVCVRSKSEATGQIWCES